MLIAYSLNKSDLTSNTVQTSFSDLTLGTIHREIIRILENPLRLKQLRSNNAKRHSVEGLLRYIAFNNREKFPGLEKTMLVKNWENMTGQQW
jgi:hypothetical protein